jgi:CheY-like chemotaxis protein
MDFLAQHWPATVAFLTALGKIVFDAWEKHRAHQRQDRIDLISEQSRVITGLRSERELERKEWREERQASQNRESRCEHRLNAMERWANLLIGSLCSHGIAVPRYPDAPRMNKRILVVDDQIDVKESLTVLLQDEGYEVIAAVDGQAALDELNRTLPSLLILDLRIPIVSGEDVLRRLLGTEGGRKLPIFILTAAPADASRLTLTSNMRVLAKPFPPERLVELIREATEIHAP